MLLWIGAILCFAAYSIEINATPDDASDHVILNHFTMPFILFKSNSFHLVVSWHCLDDSGGGDRVFFVLPREQELEDHGVVQEHGAPIGASH